MKFKRVAEMYKDYPGFSEAKKDYCNWAFINEEEEITSSSLNEWALMEASRRSAIPKHKLRKMLLGEQLEDELQMPHKDENTVTLTENTISDAIANSPNAIVVDENDRNEIEEALDIAFRTSKRMVRKHQSAKTFSGVLLEGEAGIGKTSIVKAWAKEQGVKMYSYNARTGNPEALRGIVDIDPSISKEFIHTKIDNSLIAALSRPNSILFIDELNRARPEILSPLYDLIIDHCMLVPLIDNFEYSRKVYSKYGTYDDEGYLHLDNLLFVVVAQNPHMSRYPDTRPLDQAVAGRFTHFFIKPDNIASLKYYQKVYAEDIKLAQEAEDINEEERKELIDIARGSMAIATKLLDPTINRDFHFDTSEEMDELYNDIMDKCDGGVIPPINYYVPRTLTRLLTDSEGDVKQFIKLWPKYCNPKKHETVRMLLSDLVDNDDAMSRILKSMGGVFNPVDQTKVKAALKKEQDIATQTEPAPSTTASQPFGKAKPRASDRIRNALGKD